MERVGIAVFPKDDEALRAHAEAILLDVGDPSECERRLRSVFPAVAVREQVPLASMGGRADPLVAPARPREPQTPPA